MGAIKRRNVTKIQSGYMKQHERNEAATLKKRKYLIRRLTVFFLFVGVISYFMISTLLSQASTLNEMELKKKELDHQLSDLRKTETLLQDQIVKLNDDEYIAKLARKEYFLSEDDEIIFSIPEEKKEEASSDPSY